MTHTFEPYYKVNTRKLHAIGNGVFNNAVKAFTQAFTKATGYHCICLGADYGNASNDNLPNPSTFVPMIEFHAPADYIPDIKAIDKVITPAIETALGYNVLWCGARWSNTRTKGTRTR